MKDLERRLRQSAIQAVGSSSSDDARRASQRLAAGASRHGLLDVSYTHLDSPLGTLLIAATGHGLVRVAFPEELDEQVLQELSSKISPRVLETPGGLDPIRRELDEYFTGTRRGFDIALDWKLIGSFASKILRATAAIPYGGLSTYGEVAAKAGSPRGSRAAGNALGANPIPIVIPCHRVLRTGGNLGGYAGGLDRKRHLLALEGAITQSL
jgi:methylated-DNA-[protein]-cysteine S-methyltransferase